MKCPAGHETASTDYCDTCGLAVDAGDHGAATQGVSSAADLPPTEIDTPVASAASDSCPNCTVATPPNALFCENCGYDFTTGSLPRSGGDRHDQLARPAD